MEGFDERLTVLEGAVKPLHKKANNLKTVQDNVEDALTSMNTVLDAFGTS
jgi:hypothetical protein